MFKLIFGIIAAISLIAGIILYFVFYKPLLNQRPSTPTLVAVTKNSPSDRSDRAAFAIFINGKKQDLTDSRYLNRSADAYMTTSFPDVVILENKEITWSYFFETLPLSLTNQCITLDQSYCTGQGGTLQFYINSHKVTDFLNQKIIDGDRVLITFGNETQDKIDLQTQMVANPLP